jgi:hypothetical protein
MIEFLQILEHRVGGLQSPLLAVMTLVTLSAGLFVWLGGLSCRKALFAVVGAYCGATCAIFISGSNILLTAALAGAGVLLAMRLQDTFLILMASIFAAVSVLIRPYVSLSDEPVAIIRQLTIGVPYYNWPILLALIAVPLALISTFPQGAPAVLCSAGGTCLMLACAIMLLVRNGLAAAGYIDSKRELCLALFIVATALGATAQLFLLPELGWRIAAAKKALKNRAKAKRKRVEKDEYDGSNALPTPKTAAWRTA